MICVAAVAFAVAWWLGLYLVLRGPGKPLLRWAGTGSVIYALALVADQLNWGNSTIRLVLACLPAVAWAGILPTVVRERTPAQPRRRTAAPATLAVGALMLGLSVVLILLGLHALPRPLLLSGMAFDLTLLGVGIAALDAHDEGELLRTDMTRSLLMSGGAAVLLGGQVGLVLAVTGRRSSLVALLFGTLAVAIAGQVLHRPVQAAVDRLVLASGPDRQTLTDLREAADALPRRDPGTQLAALTEAEFARITRRALSHYADLGKLVASPLMELPAVRKRTAAGAGPLDRATELKAVLTEHIARLKPRSDEDFGTSEEWRHYNALHFYYVRGIRPYSVRTKRTDLDPAARRALTWFVEQVPERTLHNWQNAAAKIIAAELRADAITVRQ